MTTLTTRPDRVKVGRDEPARPSEVELPPPELHSCPECGSGEAFYFDDPVSGLELVCPECIDRAELEDLDDDPEPAYDDVPVVLPFAAMSEWDAEIRSRYLMGRAWALIHEQDRELVLAVR